ncbi:MAG TPA: DUF2282 domain-containing protein [Acetobacteraceae bacterium]|nr:DUF2282 domain-containing protein [Acetobacteraceae bacterium]
MNVSRLVATALMTAAAVPAIAAPAPVPSFHYDRCYGIAAAHANDCQTATHSCAGQSTRAGDPQSWLYVPAGTCARIIGGSLQPSAINQTGSGR